VTLGGAERGLVRPPLANITLKKQQLLIALLMATFMLMGA
jgi:hypothetical protein